MAKTGEDIVEKENQQENIDRLAAQKEIYLQAKRLFLLQFIVTVVVTVILALVGIALTPLGVDSNWIRGGYGFMAATVDLFFLNHSVNQLRQKAAAIQELFDCEVLGLEWNKVCVGEKPKPEDIKKYSDQHLKRVKSYNKLQNWYAETIKDVDGPAAKVICQRSNFAYDSAIRKSFLSSIVAVGLAIIVLVLTVGLITNAQARSIVTMSLLPVLPILIFLGKLGKEHRASLQNLDGLSSSIISLWSDILAETANNSEARIRQIQDKIYLNRKTSPLIPEWYYDWKRPGLEQQMYYGVDELVKECKLAARSAT